MEHGYRKFRTVKVGFDVLLSFDYVSLPVEPTPCAIPALPRNAHYLHLRPFMQKIPDGGHLEYVCDHNTHRQRIICRRGKIIPRNPVCYKGRTHF